jgi:lipopolysaccharide export LptBFGC system permease protein LptF
MLASRLGGRVDPTLLVYSLPQALVLAIPVGFSFGVLLGLRDRVVSSRTAGAVVGCALLCSVACLVTLAWILPTANVEFRRQRFHQEGTIERKNLNELTLGELGQQIDSDRRSGLWVGNLLFSYHERWAFSCATVVLALFALSVTRYLVARWTVALAAFGTYLCYYAILWGGRAAAMQDALPVFPAAWLPNLVFALVSVVSLKMASHPSARRALR